MRIKSVLKYFFLILASLIGILLLAIFLLVLFFPSNMVREMAVTEISALLQRPVSIDHAEIKFFSGIQLARVKIDELPRFRQVTESDSTTLLFVEHVTLKYKFWPLLRRQLEIDEITLNAPRISLIMDSTDTWNFDVLLEALSDTASTATVDTSVSPLPISVQLEQFEIRNLQLALAMKDDSTALTLALASLTGNIYNLEIPRALPDEMLAQLKAQIRLEMRQADFLLHYISPFDSLNLKFTSKADLAFDVKSNGLSQTVVDGNLAFTESMLSEPDSNFSYLLDRPQPIPDLMRLVFQSQADLLDENIRLPVVKLFWIDELLLQGSGAIRQYATQPQVSFQIEDSRVSLPAVKDFLTRLNLQDTQELLDEIAWDGHLSLTGTRFAGNPLAENAADGMKFNTLLQLQQGELNYARNLVHLTGLTSRLEFSGIYAFAGFSDMEAQLELQVPFWETVSDTFQLQGRDLQLNLKTNLTRDFFPESAGLRISAPEIQNAHAELNLDVQTNGTWKNFGLNGVLELEHLLLQDYDIPDIAGRAAAQLSFNATALDSIHFDVTGQLDSLFFLYEDNWEPLGAQNISGDFVVKMDSLFLDFLVNPFNLKVNDYVALTGNAEFYKLGEDSFSVTVDRARVGNRNILAEMPAVFIEDLGNFDISGETLATARIFGVLPAASDPVYSGKIHIKTQNTDVDYPDVFLIARNIRIDSHVDLFVDSLNGNVNARIESFSLTDIRRKPFLNSWLKADFRMPDFARVMIPACSVGVPEIAANAWLTGTVDSLETDPVTHLDTQIQFSTTRPVEVIDDIILSGRADATNRLFFWGDLMTINGEIQFDTLNLEIVETLTANGITGKTTINQKIDLLGMRFLQEELPLFASAHLSDLEYHYLRPFYRHQTQPIPLVRIQQIRILEYELNNIFLDVLFGGAKLEIPDFRMDAYEGNIRGHLGVDFGEGTFAFPDSLLESAQFKLKATFSSLNTAKLNPVISAKAKKSIVNANLELLGNGLNPEGDLSVSGYFHITEIGSKVADNLLRSLDPMEADQGIQSVRSLLRFRYQPRLMSFEIKHGHFYPRIVLSKPFYIPINVAGGEVELARIPIEIFLKQAMASPYYTE